MGHRTLKRVSLDFTWPKKQVWKGYINPYQGPVECSLCEGSGYNLATKKIADGFFCFENPHLSWHNKITQDEVQALIAAGRLMEFTHVWTTNEGWKPRIDGKIPSADEINADQKRHGHDGINRSILIETRAKRLGVFGHCLKCRGKGSKFPAHTPHRPYNSWREYEPPAGEGYQLWETCSEGSPISPVFASVESLAIWCENNADIFSGEKMSRQQWLGLFSETRKLEAGSLFVSVPGYIGALASAPG